MGGEEEFQPKREKELSRRRKMPSAVDSAGLQDTPFTDFKCQNNKQKVKKSMAWTREEHVHDVTAPWLSLLNVPAALSCTGCFLTLSLCLPPAREEGKG